MEDDSLPDMPRTANLRRQLNEINAWWTDTAAHYEDPVPLGAVLLAELQALAKDLSIVTRELEASLYDAMPDQTAEIDGVGILSRSRAADSEKFDSEALLSKVLAVSRVDPETGEVLPSEAMERIRTILNEALPITPSLGWRKKGLSKVLGKDAWREYHEKVPGRKTVRFL